MREASHMGTQPPVRGWRAILRVRAQAERGWVDAVRGGEPEPSSAQLAQLSLPRGRRRGQKLLSTTPLLCRVLAVGRVWGEI